MADVSQAAARPPNQGLQAALSVAQARIAAFESALAERGAVPAFFLESLDRLNLAIRDAEDLDQMMSDVLDVVLAVLDADRAWLLYPCDPTAGFWRVPMERTRPEYPGALALRSDLPMAPEVRDVFNLILSMDDPVPYGPGTERPLPLEVNKPFGVKSQLVMALYPKCDKPWVFGIHQCSRSRIWDPVEQMLFKAMGRRIGDALSSLLSQRGLRESEAKFRAITENTTDGTLILDAHGVCVYASPACGAIFGLPPAALAGQGLVELVESKDARRVADLLRMASGAPDRSVSLGEFGVAHSGGEAVPLEGLATCMPGVAGEAGLVVNVRDISGRKRIEKDLATSRKLMKSILDSLPSAIIGVDEAGVVTHFNQSALAFAGRHAPGIVGLPAGEAFPLMGALADKLESALRGQSVVPVERMPVQRGAEARLMDIQVFPLASTGLGGAVIRLDDVTERVHMEDMMVQTEKMMSVGGLAAGMAHEINNPLAGIVMNAQVVLRRLTQDTPASLAAARDAGCGLAAIRGFMEARGVLGMVESMRESAVRAAHIVANMLEFSRKSESRQSMVALSVMLDKAVELCANDYDLKKKYDFRRIAIVREYQPDMPDVPCSMTQIEQVLINLLRNAAQAMAQSAERHEPPAIILRTRLAGNMARIEVEDNGPGMDVDVRRKIFEPFFSTKPPGEGTGLGLSVSYFIITTSHGGTITVDSTPRHGTKFVIELPLETARS